MDLQFVTLNVFTSKRLQGNPLAVVTVPATLKDKLTQATKQKIAQEFNLSETVFLHEVAEPDQAQQKQRDIDIFTIESELPYAGHPTIGSAVLVKYNLHPHVDTLVTKAGPIGIVPQPGNAIRARIPHNVRLHAKTLVDVLGSDDATKHPGLSPVPQIREAELKAPVFSVVKGMTFVLVKLPSLELLAQVSTAYRIDFANLPKPLLDEGWRDSFVSRYYYVDLGEEEEQRSIRSRMVELGFEDPATGSAATALGSYLTLHEEKKGRKFKLTQGVEMGRTSHINVETTTKDPGDGSVALEELWLGGTAIVVMKGTLTVDI
ncbi:Diaminopimelate epimerase-like protein [Annulohypoxylon maeteangense]|uniref:Diaminopimelate epimerase-like protein n=1 Tax=Annulohypoxylon maeteangense TaxID=1927788 RepID=UPI002007A0E2|nr:Diaminopimelate epimerase-like protein [Annulohypoxylon maeteangense]KAI0890289.1 Diaminopimelate epimerase-like protein [Annulohypoxylon maeteangense]